MANENRIMRLPVGLLSFFDTKSLGQNPPQFDESLRVVCDMYNHYLPNSELSVIQANGIAAGAADAGDITVPNGEAWVVRGMGVNTAGAAGGVTATISMLIIPSGSSFGMNVGTSVVRTTGGAGIVIRHSHWFDPFYIAMGGTTFRHRIDDSSVITNNSTQLLFHRLRV